MRLINLVGLFFLLFSFAVAGRNLPVRNPEKSCANTPGYFLASKRNSGFVIYSITKKLDNTRQQKDNSYNIKVL